MPQAFVAEWEDLEHHAIEPNVYLSPDFVIPAGEQLAPSPGLLVLRVRVDGRLAGLGVFQQAGASWRMPCPHLRAYASPYALVTGLLLRRGVEREALGGLLRWMREDLHAPRAIEFEEWRTDGPTAPLLGALLPEFGLDWWSYYKRERAVLLRAQSGGSAFDALGSKRRKNMRRALRDLEAIGPVRWELLRGPGVTPAAVDRFLALEALGWKGEEGTAMLSKPADTRFFRDVVDRLAVKNRVFFSELWCGDQIVASNSNFIAGDMGFAFKVGWDPRFRDQSPGILNELQFMEGFAEAMPDIACIDGGAQPGSFIDGLWAGRMALEWGMLVSGALLSSYGQVLSAVREIRDAVRPPAGRDGADTAGGA